jgi:4-amino-4-deoxychorismate lyase
VVEACQTLVNGRAATQVGALDRGLAYGDGVFRTIRIDAGRPRWWEEHLHKLHEDCHRLGLACPSHEAWQRDLAQLELPLSGVLRLTVTRGEGPRGYGFPASPRSTRIVTVWSGKHSELPENGIATRVCHLRLGHQPALAGVKHLNRLENVLARAEWQDPEIREGILLDQAGHVVSGVMSNIFLWQDGLLRTPRLDKCGVAGVARGRLMSLAAKSDYGVEETEITLGDIYAADELMFTNSLNLLWRAARLENRAWGAPVVSTSLRDLLNA